MPLLKMRNLTFGYNQQAIWGTKIIQYRCRKLACLTPKIVAFNTVILFSDFFFNP